MSDITFIIPPYTDINYPYLGVACLAGYLRRRGYSSEVIDLSSLVQTRYAERVGNAVCDIATWQDRETVRRSYEELFAIPEVAARFAQVTSPVIGFSLFSSNKLSTLELARLLRRDYFADRIFVGGGPDCFQVSWLEDLEEEDRRQFNAFVHSEGEQPLAALLQSVREGAFYRAVTGISYVMPDGHFRKDYDREYIADLDTLPVPDFSGFAAYRYHTDYLPVLFSRGCISKCVFCDVNRYWPRFRIRAPEAMVTELRELVTLYGTRTFYFCDSLLNASPGKLEELCDLLIAANLGLQLFGIGIPRRHMTPALLAKMSAAGFYSIEYGVESGSQKVLTDMGKLHQASSIGTVLRDTARAGIKVNIDLLVGFPGETTADFQMTCELVKQYGRCIDKVVGLDCCNIGRDTAVGRGLMEKFGMTYTGDRSHSDWHDAFGNTPETRLRRKLRLFQLVREQGIAVSEYVWYLEKAARVRCYSVVRRCWEAWLDRWYYRFRYRGRAA